MLLAIKFFSGMSLWLFGKTLGNSSRFIRTFMKSFQFFHHDLWAIYARNYLKNFIQCLFNDYVWDFIPKFQLEIKHPIMFATIKDYFHCSNLSVRYNNFTLNFFMFFNNFFMINWISKGCFIVKRVLSKVE